MSENEIDGRHLPIDVARPMITRGRTNMSQTLYEQFLTALKSLPDGDVIGAFEVAESFVTGARHNCTTDTVLSLVPMGRPADRLVLLFDGRTVGEAATVMTQLRGEIADELVRSGAPAEVVREVRESGPSSDGDGEIA
jgi:hypothetical protein